MAPPDLDQYLPGILAEEFEAFGSWLAGAESHIRNSLRSFAIRADVEDVVQETAMRIWQTAPRFVADGRENGLLRLAIRVARNLAISELRRYRVEPAEIDVLVREAERYDPMRAGAPRAPDPLLARRIEDCIGRLPQQPGRAIAARVGSQGAEPDEAVAERLGMRKNTFLQNITRARKLIANCLARHGINLAEELS
ncbi:MAG TPA: RNA polymerase sigma factor [Methylomirabilota bacterium]|nr:RNA polymerase sigma factor [Methylomirabilota bacterium]